MEPKSAKVLEKIELQCRPDSSKDSRPPSQQAGGKVSKKQQEEQQKLLEQQKALEERLEKEREEVVAKLKREKIMIGCRNKHQQLNLSTQYGLHINCSIIANSLEDDTAGSVIIKQEAPLAHCPPPLSEETSRVCLPDGSVIKYMKDRTVTVLCSDGGVMRSLRSGSPYESLFETGNDEVFEREGQASANTQPRVSFMENIGLAKGVPSPADALWEVTHSDGSRCVLKYIEVSGDDDKTDESNPSENHEKPSDDDEKTLRRGSGEDGGVCKDCQDCGS